MKLPIEQIKIGERQRIELGDLHDLDTMAEKDIGQILPIVVHRVLDGYELVDGRRRLAKAVELKWTHIEAFEKDQLTESQKQRMELFADVCRKDRTWQEKCLAVAKIFRVMKREKAATGETWNLRIMEDVIGLGKSLASRMLVVAKALAVEPKDEELWKQESYYDAWKLIIEREFNEVNRSKEQRRLVFNSGAVAVVVEETSLPLDIGQPPTAVDDGPLSDGTPAPSPVPVRDTTEPMRVVLTHGRRETFNNYNPEGKLFPCALLYKPTDAQLYKALACLESGGYAVSWGINSVDHSGVAESMPFHLFWNAYGIGVPEKCYWPFYHCVIPGTVYRRLGKDKDVVESPSSNCISAGYRSNGMVPAVVLFSLDTVIHEGRDVLLVGDISPKDVAETGRVPFWFEPDAEAWSTKQAELEKFYKETIPNVVVRSK